MGVFEDRGGTMRFEEVRRLPEAAFRPLGTAVDSHLFTSSTFWYRFDVVNPGDLPLERLVVVEIPWIDHIRATVVSPNRAESTYEVGNIYPFERRTIKHRYSNFAHPFVSGPSTVYVQVKTRDPFVVPISVLDTADFFAKDARESVHTGFIYGFIAAMLFYNLFLFLSIKARYYAFYVLYLSCFLVMTLSYNGHTFGWFFPEHPDVQNWAQSTTIFLFSISGLLFARSFLDFRKYSLLLDRLTISLILFFVAAMFLSAAAGYAYHVMFAIALTVLFSLYVLSVAFYSLLRGNRSAKFFILGTIAGLIGTSITALSVMALIPYSDAGFKAVDYGMVIDTVLLSLALADRVRITQEEKVMAEKEAKTDAMTGLPNRKAYDEIRSTEVERAMRYGTQLCLVMLDIDHFKDVNDTYGHLAGDKMLGAFAEGLRQVLRKTDTPFRLGGEEFLILLPQTDLSDARQLAERIRQSVENIRVSFQDRTIAITVSLGISDYRRDDRSIEDAEKRADEALYKAKSMGRNRIVVA